MLLLFYSSKDNEKNAEQDIQHKNIPNCYHIMLFALQHAILERFLKDHVILE